MKSRSSYIINAPGAAGEANALATRDERVHKFGSTSVDMSWPRFSPRDSDID